MYLPIKDRIPEKSACEQGRLLMKVEGTSTPIRGFPVVPLFQNRYDPLSLHERYLLYPASSVKGLGKNKIHHFGFKNTRFTLFIFNAHDYNLLLNKLWNFF